MAMALLVHRQSSSSYSTCIRTVLRFYSTQIKETQQKQVFNPNYATLWNAAYTPEQIPKSKGLPEVGLKSLENLLHITENSLNR
jgi:hypothetical protein